MRQVHAAVRLGLGAHAHFAPGLHAEKAGQTVFIQHLCPGAVGQNHHFGYQRVDGRAAFAAADAYAAVGIEFDAIVVLRGAVFFVAVTLFLAFDGETVQPAQLRLAGELYGFVLGEAGVGVEMRLDVLDAQVVFDA